MKRRLRRWIRGDADLPQECLIGCSDPQAEVRVMLGRQDVTHRHAQVCTDPLTIAAEAGADAGRLVFHSVASGAVLGEIELTLRESVGTLGLFAPVAFQNRCLPRSQLWRELGFLAYQRWQTRMAMGSDESLPTPLAFGAMTVLFTCPRPVVSVTVQYGERPRTFPMNLLCDLSSGRLVFALKSAREERTLTELAGRVTVSNIALDSESATRVREVEIESATPLGSHTLFIGRVVSDQRQGEGSSRFLIHGIYQAWRIRNGLGQQTDPLRRTASDISIFRE